MKFFLPLLFFSYTVIAQMFPYYHYTVDDGLPHSMVYFMLHDKKGFLWFTTDNGVSKYDGETFTNFSTADGLLSNCAIPITESPDGKIFVGVYGKGVDYIQNNKVYNYQKNLRMKTFLIEKDGVLYVDVGDNLLRLYDTTSKKSLYKTRVLKINDSYLSETFELLVKTQQGILISNSINNGLYRIEKDTLLPYQPHLLYNEKVYSLYEEKENILWIGSVRKILKIEDSVITKTIALPFKEKVIGLLVDSQKRIWFSIPNRGVFLFDKEKIISIGEKLGIEKDHVGPPYEDRDGNIWIIPHGKSGYCLYNTYISNYSVRDGLSHNYIKTITKDRYGRILIGSTNGVTIIHNDTISQPRNNFHNYEVRNFFTEFKDKTIILGSGDYGKKQKKVPYDNYTTYHHRERFTAVTFLNKDTLLSGSWGNWLEINDLHGKQLKWIVPYKKNPQPYVKTKKIYKDVQNRIWIGTNAGLCRYVNTDSVYCYEGNTPLTGIIEDITEDNTHTLWIATNKGVMQYTNDEWKTVTFPEHPINEATSLQFDSNNHLWLGTSNGLYYYDGKTVKHFTKHSGLISNNVNTLYYDKETNFLWVGTTEGISKIDITQYHSSISKPLTPIISKVILQDTTIYEPPSSVQISWKKNRAKIYFAGFHFQRPKSVHYEYHLNEDSVWQQAQGNMVELLNIDYGTTEIFMRAKIENGEWSVPITLLIEKETPWWATSTATMTLIFFSAVSLVYGINRKIKTTKRKAEEKSAIENKVRVLEHKTAMIAMMNPHFIFNALNSIQYFINHKETEHANTYLARVARLIRLNLELSDKETISLKQELERVEFYLSLEQLRRDNIFSYHIIVDSSIMSEQVFVPNMILQPIAENALKHGILPSRREGHIYIKVEKHNHDVLSITIEDNGVGLQENKNSSHYSTGFGLTIVINRLYTLYQHRASFSLCNNSTENSFPTGAHAKIILPIINNSPTV